MFLLRRLVALFVFGFITLIHGRSLKRARFDIASKTKKDCSTNAECLKLGLPPLAPNRTRKRQGGGPSQGPTYPTETFKPTGVQQQYSFPSTGCYNILAQGAQGGGCAASNVAGGTAAALSVIYCGLQQGDNIYVIVGEQGGQGGIGPGGGGGGSFVYFMGTSTTPVPASSAIVIAAGGGGAPYGGNADGASASSSTTNPGTGQGGSGTSTAGGGAGFLLPGNGADGGFSQVGNFKGGQGQSASGGFGGGGGADGSLGSNVRLSFFRLPTAHLQPFFAFPFYPYLSAALFSLPFFVFGFCLSLSKLMSDPFSETGRRWRWLYRWRCRRVYQQ